MYHKAINPSDRADVPSPFVKPNDPPPLERKQKTKKTANLRKRKAHDTYSKTTEAFVPAKTEHKEKKFEEKAPLTIGATGLT